MEKWQIKEDYRDRRASLVAAASYTGYPEQKKGAARAEAKRVVGITTIGATTRRDNKITWDNGRGYEMDKVLVPNENGRRNEKRRREQLE